MYNTLDLPESEIGDSCYEVNEKEKALSSYKKKKRASTTEFKGKKKARNKRKKEKHKNQDVYY